MMTIDLKGLVVPPTTPFDDRMRIDEKAYAAHLEYLSRHGVKRILVNGTTAEFFSLMPEERKELLVLSKKYFDGTILFNTGSDSLLMALEASKWAADCGADAIVAMTPYYFAGVPEEGLLSFFNELSSGSDLPMVLYNFREHTNNPITKEMLKAVDHIAIKDSSGDYSLIDATPCYLAGTSTKMVEAKRAGAGGFVSSLANYLPALYVRMEAALNDAEMIKAEEIVSEITERKAELKGDIEISAIKKQLSMMISGYKPYVRLPLI